MTGAVDLSLSTILMPLLSEAERPVICYGPILKIPVPFVFAGVMDGGIGTGVEIGPGMEIGAVEAGAAVVEVNGGRANGS